MIYLLLPAFNEEQSIDKLFDNLISYTQSSGLEISIILLDDGSTDRTSELAESKHHMVHLNVLKHSINRGLGETARDLFEHAASVALPNDIIIRMDCDNTQDPSVITRMVEMIQKNEADVIITSRFRPGGGMSGVNAYRSFISYCANLFMKTIFPMKGVRDYSSGFRAYRASIIQDAVKVFGNNFIQLKGMGFTGTLEKLIKLKLLGAKFAEVGHFLHYDRKQSSSKMITSITSFGYLVMAVLYHWPFSGWRSQYRGLAESYRGDRKLFNQLIDKRLRRFETVPKSE